ncbi:MAG: type IV pilin protein [Aeromonas sp.]
MTSRRAKGLTLIELMIAVAIVAIIAAVAYPSFRDGLRQSRRADALKGLLSLQLKQEEYRITHASYASDPSVLGNPSSDYYIFAISAASATNYSLTATTRGAQVGDQAGGVACDQLTLTKGDVKAPAACW